VVWIKGLNTVPICCVNKLTISWLLSSICCVNNIIDSVVKAGRALQPKTLELEGLCVLNSVNGFACSVNAGLLRKFSFIKIGIPYGWSLQEFYVFMTISSNLILTWGLGEVGTLVDPGTVTSQNQGVEITKLWKITLVILKD